MNKSDLQDFIKTKRKISKSTQPELAEKAGVGFEVCPRDGAGKNYASSW